MPATSTESRPHVVILAGGKGARFWPLGRESRPKQLLALDGDDRRSLLAATYQRVAPLADRRGPWVVASRSIERDVRRLLPSAARERLVFEPRGRNTAAAMILAAHAVRLVDPQAPMVVVPSDQHVGPAGRYLAALKAMLARAAERWAIVTLGLRPTRPATGYGYLKVGRRLARTPAGPVHEVERFVEKPPLALAKRFARGRRYLWNGGTFAFRPDVLISEAYCSAKDVHAAMKPVLDRRDFRAGLERAYRSVPSISVDYAILERSSGSVECLAASLDWDDLGSFDAVARHGKPDRKGNVLPARTVAVDASNCYVRTDDGSTVALLGVSDLMVVRTKDALLVARKGRGEEVRRVVDALAKEGRKDLLA